MFSILIVLICLTIVYGQKVSFTKRIYSHHDGEGEIADWNCRIGHFPYGEDDPTPYLVALMHSKMERNSDCTSMCTENLNEIDTEKTGIEDTAYCGKDVNGECARALQLVWVSHAPTKCSPSFHIEINDERRFHVDLEFTDVELENEKAFTINVRRPFDEDFTCEKAKTTECNIVSSCNGFHMAIDTRDPIEGECDDDCHATGDYCLYQVCHKVDDKCKVSQRLLTSGTNTTTECRFTKPEDCSKPEFKYNLELYGYWYQLQKTNAADNIGQYCCSEEKSSTPAMNNPGTTSLPIVNAPSNALNLFQHSSSLMILLIIVSLLF